jgi:hypothetical protein
MFACKAIIVMSQLAGSGVPPPTGGVWGYTASTAVSG